MVVRSGEHSDSQMARRPAICCADLAIVICKANTFLEAQVAAKDGFGSRVPGLPSGFHSAELLVFNLLTVFSGVAYNSN
jgi:hypothetical protein